MVADSGVAVLVVVVGEELGGEGADAGEGAESVGKSGAVFQGVQGQLVAVDVLLAHVWRVSVSASVADSGRPTSGDTDSLCEWISGFSERQSGALILPPPFW